MTKGPIIKTILKLALPIMASSFLGTLYNICDIAWVGTLGAKAIAGVGVGGMYMWLTSGLVIICRMGGQVLTAQSIGAGDEKAAGEYAKAAIQITLLLSLAVGALGALFAPQMVSFFRMNDVASETAAIKYIRITVGLTLFAFLANTLTGIYTACGDSKTPLIANLFGLVINLVLDPMLIMGIGFFPRMDTLGAAVATVLAQVISSIILVVRMRANNENTAIFRGQNYLSLCEKERYARVIRIGAPAGIQSMGYCFISMLVTRIVSGFGAEAVAVSRVGGQIESISWNTANGFSSAINSFTGQNFGARKFDRIRKGYYFAALASVVWGGLVCICFLLFPGFISGFFFHDEATLALSIAYLTIIGISEPFIMVQIVSEGTISGLGKTKLCSILSISFALLRLPLATILKNTALGLNGIWWCFTITSVLMGVVYLITFFSLRMEKLPQVIGETA
ncbi:MAG: MATE family efflux transporter [Oscillospiraceae bacterium]|nr:MATE family efflux transporter [Oscillospiraceae bacterium]